MIIALLVAAAQSGPISDPISFGNAELSRALSEAHLNVPVQVKLQKKSGESYAVDFSGKKIVVNADGVNGAMYGLLEMAERVQNDPAHALDPGTASGSPYLHDRGLNLFLTLPWDYVKNTTDNDPKALVDPKRWWFQNEDYWRTLLDLMARSRFNWLDIHGTWDINVTSAPNLYAYFIQSEKYPLVGVDPDIKAANLRQLNHVIQMAHARGIRVSLMAYEAGIHIPQNPNPPYKATEDLAYNYTREMVEKMIRQAPGLDAIGFRIGESGKGESFFNCYNEAVKRSGRNIPLVTRSWITRKQNVLPLARNSKDFTVEIKYNGEQWGVPYQIAGGRVANWYSYSFEDYLSDSGPGKAAKMWPGNPIEGQTKSHWPDEPYKIVWQVRANGTSRIMPLYNAEMVRRSIKCMKTGTTSGYTIEGLDAYYPKDPLYYLKNPEDKYCDWTHQRDEMYWMSWGRLGYDPNTPDSVFDKHAERLLGPGSHDLVEAWKKSSTLLPWAFGGFSIGPDHRDHAPELEWGGDTNYFIDANGFDSHSFLPIGEEFANHATGGVDGRMSLSELGRFLSDTSDDAAQLGRPFLDSKNKRVKEIATTVQMQSARGEYYANRFMSAHALADIEANFDKDYGDVETAKIRAAASAHQILADSPYYKPFTERLRMHTNNFTWAAEDKKVQAEATRIEALTSIPRDFQHYVANSGPYSPAKLTWTATAGTIKATVVGNAHDAWLLEKPLPSSTFFHKSPMNRVGDHFEAEFKRQPWGHMIAAEVQVGTKTMRIPEAMKELPYEVIPSEQAPTPQLYNAEEAMTFLKPEVITPQKFGAMLIGTRGWGFFSSFDVPTKRKILEPVKRGVTLVVLQQDFNKYKLDWLPKPLRFEGGNMDTFDPGGALELPKVDEPGIMYQHFVPSDGWQIHGNGGLASMTYGAGTIWVCSARLMQYMRYPKAADAFVKILGIGGKSKPTVLIDSCSEGGQYASSCHPDMMNDHGIPFKTLGEVIAEEQGMDSFKKVAGPVSDDTVLNGRGPDIMKNFLIKKTEKAAARPIPATKEEEESRKAIDRKELMRALGLDPLPPRTPLNVKITGGFKRPGYRVENIVLESRPNFPVTMNLYIPDNAKGKLPVIVCANGHWEHKKMEPVVQSLGISQALDGYLSCVVDSPGWSFEGNTFIERRNEGPHNDFKLLLGSANTTAVYVWDMMRVLDYLETRPEADMQHVGLTGASGGGLLTLYAFAAEPRFKVAIPVVYAVSMELAPFNGCLCNHVPGTLQIGDRSDVLAIRAPAPVYLISAHDDGEFTPEAAELMGKKMRQLWGLYGAEADTGYKIFPGGHDYNRPMRELAMGFFNKHLRGLGDGSPVPEPAFTPEPADSMNLVCIPDPKPNRTMRDIAAENLAKAKARSWDEVVKLNGGLPGASPLNVKEVYASKGIHYITFESEPGLTIPGVLRMPAGKPKAGVVLVNEAGKIGAAAEAEKLTSMGYATLAIDVRGVGELNGIDQRLTTYLGTSIPFAMGWDISRAAEAMKAYAPNVAVVGWGPSGSQAAMYAGLIDPKLKFVAGLDGVKEFADCFADSVPDEAVQPRADLCSPLSNLRSMVKPAAMWSFGETVDWISELGKHLKP